MLCVTPILLKMVNQLNVIILVLSTESCQDSRYVFYQKTSLPLVRWGKIVNCLGTLKFKQFRGKYVVLALGGEEDAMATYQMLGGLQ